MADGSDAQTSYGQSERFDKLRLIRSANIGPVSYFQLLARFGTAGAALSAIPELAGRGGGRAPRIAEIREIESEIRAVEKLGARHLFVGEGLYPTLLAELDSAPPVLIVRGNLRLLDRPAVAIVGARNASAAACRFARGLAHDLAEEGCIVVSGLARGIDTAAHQGALGQGQGGATAAIIASGIDIAFPPENEELQENIAQFGVLIAEQIPGREPLARHFPSRNRIIAGLAIGTVIVEAAPRSGSLITARLANEAGREVMAVPGSPLDPRAQGCNALIRDGATLIQNAGDVLETIRPMSSHVAQPSTGWRAAPVDADASDVERRAITNLLGHTPVSVDELVRQSGFHPAVVATVLLELELGGRLERHAGGRVSLGKRG
ncbi:DNA-protecting protein DprA [Sphingomonas paeninsulae]|uniref:DNA-protecting protein DprA n=1 Tax=Sphingomonas paeninsulae TaxID=2319844 RepID=A0A494TKM8_SPHPE|nr:DNA-processing protein DprA [Sphingomonas paeninsulae]AYJ85978.1 DNA-protecting protein DprA [Sphingomonas paeninsulae]